ncbi:MAG: GGDEF domain-containing phosphodiesterase [Eubacterium sp.]|nr:GGDEF domain-containing phosphodiesterase [Eubacterium sp.]
MEQLGKGEVFCDFDNGKDSTILLRIRIESSTKAVIIGTLYTTNDFEDYTNEELTELDTMLRIIIGFVSRKRILRMLENFGFYDIDGYRNFRSFARYLDIANAENRLGGMVAFHIDLHNFTMVNQEVGRDNGDIVLKKYYDLLTETIGDKGIIARLGGDKFIGVLNRSIKRQVFDLFSGTTISINEASDQKIYISAATGVFMIPNPFMLMTYGDIMDKIMLAGMTAKRQSSGSIVVYDEKMKNSQSHVKKVQTEFREALKNEEFHVYYQPKVDIETKKLKGSEALCRWIKDKTIIPPNDFIPILEINTDICQLDFYMLDHVCKDIRRWLDEGKEVVRVSVNFSRKHLIDVNVLEKIIATIDKNNVPHEYIEIELTETTTDVLFSDLRRVVCGLQEQGIWTAVDDFGVGYSSLNLIRDLPWNVLKIDKSFVPTNVEEESSIQNKMFKHVISLAHDLGLECVIEGVETLDQLEVLRLNKCNIAQGYFFDKPLPLEDYENRLNERFYSMPY